MKNLWSNLPSFASLFVWVEPQTKGNVAIRKETFQPFATQSIKNEYLHPLYLPSSVEKANIWKGAALVSSLILNQGSGLVLITIVNDFQLFSTGNGCSKLEEPSMFSRYLAMKRSWVWNLDSTWWEKGKKTKKRPGLAHNKKWMSSCVSLVKWHSRS